MMPARKGTLNFKIIAGSLRGRKISVPDVGVTRPPLSRLRKSIFDFLMPYMGGASYLDLFSGTGSYLFEAVSRGAASALGVEAEPLLAAHINAQAENLGVSDRLNCLSADVFDVVPQMGNSGRTFDIIMIAPPQYKGYIDRTLAEIQRAGITRPGGLIICQHDTSERKLLSLSDFEVVQERKYGNTTFTVLAPMK
ncbi:MAG: RsmD family RNA methyltransferase [Candidatus Zixiibacteriota bacterium]|nr:MAG: RsmD family RNA methyltransferase [candidate division Zixibacteria bacterium]